MLPAVRSPWDPILPLTHDTFEAFGFAEPLSRALTQCGYATPTPIQAQALQPQLDGRDLLALAETGSGKTAAFLLPLLQDFALNPVTPNTREVLALVLAPTRELALQIDQEVASLSRNMHEIRRTVVLGGVSKGPQINALKRGVHVLVATPGRLLDLVDERFADLRPVRTFVLDEADRMFDMGFIRDVKKIASLLSHKRRTAMFSATMPTEIRSLAHDLLNDPYRVDLSPKQVVVDRIDQKLMIVRANEKQSRLHTLLQDDAWSRVIVFTRTKRGADRVASRLGMAGFGAAAIHGNKAQNARQRALKDFSAGHVRVLVATDIAARGIDVSDVSHVVNFDMPVEPETYVHRIGRTARRGTTGVAVSLCDPSEKGEIYAIERLMKQPIEVIDDVGGETLPPLERQPRSEERERNGGRAGRGERREARGGRDRPRGEGRGDRRTERNDRRDRNDAHAEAPVVELLSEGRSDVRAPRRDENRGDSRGRGRGGMKRGPGREGREGREGMRGERRREAHGEDRPAFDPLAGEASLGERPQREGRRGPHHGDRDNRGARPHGRRDHGERGTAQGRPEHAERRGGDRHGRPEHQARGGNGEGHRDGNRDARGHGSHRASEGGHRQGDRAKPAGHHGRHGEAHGPARERANGHRAHDRHTGDRKAGDRHGGDRHGADRHGADRSNGERHGADRTGAQREPRRDGKPGWNGHAPNFMNGLATRRRHRGPAA